MTVPPLDHNRGLTLDKVESAVMRKIEREGVITVFCEATSRLYIPSIELLANFCPPICYQMDRSYVESEREAIPATLLRVQFGVRVRTSSEARTSPKCCGISISRSNLLEAIPPDLIFC